MKGCVARRSWCSANFVNGQYVSRKSERVACLGATNSGSLCLSFVSARVRGRWKGDIRGGKWIRVVIRGGIRGVIYVYFCLYRQLVKCVGWRSEESERTSLLMYCGIGELSWLTSGM